MSYVAHTPADREAMLEAIGVRSVEELFADLPAAARLQAPLKLPPHLDEMTLHAHLAGMAATNEDASRSVCFLGAGIYDHFTPALVDAIISRGEFATSYTPYQPEVSQGMLQAIYEYQSLICELTGMDMSNASMYDGATALAEAALMAVETTQHRTVVVSRSVHPHYRQVLRTYADAADVRVLEAPIAGTCTDMDALGALVGSDAACVVLQHPNFLGSIEELSTMGRLAASAGAVSIAVVDPVSLGLLKPPGDVGIDVVVGEGQGIGSSMSFGGPLLGFFAFRSAFQRRFPGRIVGATTDHEGRRGYTMTLRTREQDIRREKATSNICTNEALVALAATVHLCALGPQGLRDVATLCLNKAHYAADRLARCADLRLANTGPFFKEFVVRFPVPTDVTAVLARLAEQGIAGGYALGRTYPEFADSLLVCVTERRTKAEIDRLVDAITRALGRPEASQ